MGDKLDPNDKATIEAAISKVKTAVSGADVEAIKASTEELQKAFYAVSEKMYQQANPQGAQGGCGTDCNCGGDCGAQGGGNYYDADYEVVDDDK